MNIEESKILLKDFQKGKIEKDKLEHYRNGYKMGYFYTVGIQEAIETVLNELEYKQAELEKKGKEIEQLEIKIDNLTEEQNEREKYTHKLEKELNEENNRCMILANNDKFKEQIIDEMSGWINKIDSTIFCNESNCNGNCKECVIKEFTKKVEKEGVKDE